MSLSRFKLSAEPEKEIAKETPEKAEGQLLRNSLMGGALVLPFAGAIGDKPNIHAGKGREFESIDALRKHVLPGDVILSSPHEKPFTTLGIGLGTGVPDVTHAGFVDDMGRVVSTRADAHTAGPILDSFEPGRAYTVLRPKAGGPLNPAELARNYRRQYDLAEHLSEQMRRAGATPEAINKMRSEFYAKTPLFIRTPVHAVAAPSIGRHGAGDAAKKKFKEFLANPTLENIHSCAGGWCTFPGAAAFPEGVDVRPGRSLRDTTPVDFLKSPHLEAVGGIGRNKNRYVDKMLRAGPTAARLTYGTLAALGVYGGFKGYDALKKHFKKVEAPPVSDLSERGTA